MGEFATKTEDEEGEVRWLASDGKSYKTRAGAWKHSKNLEAKAEPEPVDEVEPSPVDDSEPDPLSWASVDFSGDVEDAPSEVFPTTLKAITPSKAGVKKTKKEIAAEMKTNVAVLKIGYRSADHMMTRYKRAMMEDKNADAISRSEADYNWIAGITNAALVENGMSVGEVIGTTQIAVVANVYFFGAPIAKIHAEADKSPFKGNMGGRVGRFLERVPFIGPRLKARKEARYAPLQQNEVRIIEPTE